MNNLQLHVTKIWYFTCKWFKKSFMYSMPSKHFEYLNIYMKIWFKKLVLKSSTSKNTRPRLLLQLKSSPQTVFDANILSNITYQILKYLLCVFNFSSSLSVFVASPGGHIYHSSFYHHSYGYCWCDREIISIELINKFGHDKHSRPFTNFIIFFKNLALNCPLFMN